LQIRLKERLFEEEMQRQLRQIEAEERRRQVREILQQTANPGIDGAVNKASQELLNTLPERSRVAVITVTSDDSDMSVYIAEELEYRLVSSGKFIIVDRNRLDTLREELNFQMSGEVSDASAVSIGKMTGANVIITGTVSKAGSNRRLSIKAISVETAEVVTMTRQDF
jgi:hypothetical protein